MELIKNLGTRLSKNKKYVQSYGLFKCSYCGKQVETRLSTGRSKDTCGCFVEKCGMYCDSHVCKQSRGCFIPNRKTPLNRKTRLRCYQTLYRVWSVIKGQCSNSNSANYKYYGAKGIKVCDEWLDNSVFIKWALNNGYEKGKVLYRIDKTKGYSPDNCKYGTAAECQQARGKTKLTVKSVRKIKRDFAKGKYTKSKLSKLHDVTTSHINAIITGSIWKNA